MNSILITYVNRTLLPGLLLLAALGNSPATNAQTARYVPSAVENVWLSSDLSSDAALPATTDNRCPKRYEKVPGTNFCLTENTSLTMRDNIYLVSKANAMVCGNGFSRPSEDSLLCLDNQLALAWIEDTLTLVLQQCPTGFVDAQTATGCAPAREPSTEVSPSGNALRCKPGYMIVENINICVATNIALRTSREMNFGIRPSDGPCSPGRKRIKEGGFCVPSRALTKCDASTFPCTSGHSSTVCLSPTEDIGCCPMENLSVHDIPRFDGQSFTTEEVFSCALGPGSVIPDCDDPDFNSTFTN